MAGWMCRLPGERIAVSRGFEESGTGIVSGGRVIPIPMFGLNVDSHREWA